MPNASSVVGGHDEREACLPLISRSECRSLPSGSCSPGGGLRLVTPAEQAARPTNGNASVERREQLDRRRRNSRSPVTHRERAVRVVLTETRSTTTILGFLSWSV
jgi:hypothetical protein